MTATNEACGRGNEATARGWSASRSRAEAERATMVSTRVSATEVVGVVMAGSEREEGREGER